MWLYTIFGIIILVIQPGSNYQKITHQMVYLKKLNIFYSFEIDIAANFYRMNMCLFTKCLCFSWKLEMSEFRFQMKIGNCPTSAQERQSSKTEHYNMRSTHSAWIQKECYDVQCL